MKNLIEEINKLQEASKEPRFMRPTTDQGTIASRAKGLTNVKYDEDMGEGTAKTRFGQVAWQVSTNEQAIYVSFPDMSLKMPATNFEPFLKELIKLQDKYGV